MYRCEICGTCSEPRQPRYTWWGVLGHYHEIAICLACKGELLVGFTIRYLLRKFRPEAAMPSILTQPILKPSIITFPHRHTRRI